MKETFIIRTEWYDAIQDLSAEEQAVILRNLFNYHIGCFEKIEIPTIAVKIAWRFIEPNLVRNMNNYDSRKLTSATNGALGGRPKKPNNLTEEPKITKKPIETLSVSVSDSVPVSDIVLESESEEKNAPEKFDEFEILSEEEKEKKIPPVAPPPQFVNPNAARRAERSWAGQVPLPYQSPEFAQAWELWAEHRKARGDPFVSREDEENSVKLLNSYPDEAFLIRLISRAIDGKWRSLSSAYSDRDYQERMKNKKNKPKNEQRNEQFLDVAQQVATNLADPTRKNQFDY